MRIAIAAASVFVLATVCLVPATPAAARDVENGISDLSARGGTAYRGARGVRGPRAGVGVRAVGVPASTVGAPTTTIVAPSTVGVGVRATDRVGVRARRR